MALTPLTPVPKVPLAETWELVAPEAGRSSRGLRASVHLFNGTAQACQTLVLGDPLAQQALVTAFASVAGLAAPDLATALAQLTAAVEGVLRQMATQGSEERQSQATRLVALAHGAGAVLFHTPEGEGYASLPVDHHTETWPLKVKGFRRWLARRFFHSEGKAPGAQAVQDALGVLEGQATFDGPELPVSTRLAEHNGAIYLDLADDHWQAIAVTPHGWRVVADPPVKFWRSRGMLPLPRPRPGGSLAALRPFVNLTSEDDWRLLVAWLVAALRPTGPYPVLVVHGEQGSAKSSVARVLRSLVDPNTAGLRTTPRDERDLVIAAHNGWLIALDNLSHLPEWLSDGLCRLATGSGFATRELYSDAEEVIFAAQRPIVLNGIEELATRGDLLDRALVLYLPTIPDDKRQHEKAFWQAFEEARPQILGALLDIVSTALRTLPEVRLDRLPRMADFALWAAAAAAGCGWTAEAFLATYSANREAARDLTLDASPVALVVRDLVATHGHWAGPAGALLAALEQLAGDTVPRQQAWPKNPRALSNTLRRLAPTLRAAGVEVTFAREAGGKRSRLLTLTAL